jgi:hypothetical protein
LQQSSATVKWDGVPSDSRYVPFFTGANMRGVLLGITTAAFCA